MGLTHLYRPRDVDIRDMVEYIRMDDPLLAVRIIERLDCHSH